MSETDNKEDSCFIDTNVWLYTLILVDDPKKTARAKEVIRTDKTISVSTQVINEACNNLIKKAQFSEPQIQQLIESFYAKHLVIESNKAIMLKASKLRERYKFSFWDSQIVASALSAKAAVLYSEDMHDGLIVDEQLRIVNPFQAS
jgi:predicted nucleic acid-binding protein